MNVYGAIVFGGDAADLLDAEAVIFVVGLEGYKIPRTDLLPHLLLHCGAAGNDSGITEAVPDFLHQPAEECWTLQTCEPAAHLPYRRSG